MKKKPTDAEIKRKIDAGRIRVSDWPDLHRHLEDMRDSGWIFRGVVSTSHYPVPSIGREDEYGEYDPQQERSLFEEFKLRVAALMNDPRLDDWDWLAYAQHIGVPTRLLDWTASPLAALFFALERDSNEDRIVYAVKYSKSIHEIDRSARSPFDNHTEGRFTPPLKFARLQAQRGLFTIHPDPTKIFYVKGMQALLIPSDKVAGFRRRLFKYGIDHWHNYPDAYGLGQQMSWQYKNRVGVGPRRK